MSTFVNTVLGPVPAGDLGVVAINESLLSVFPGAQYAYDITLDRAEIFDALAAKLREFRAAGGGTVVDGTGMFHGRDLPLLEALSRATGVHLVASTGMGPEAMLGGYFLTPQTNPPTPWPAERFAALFAAEVAEGMVVPRVERRAPAGLVATAVSRNEMTATDESLVRGAARAARDTGAPLLLSAGADPARVLDIVAEEGLPSDRVVVGGLDRRDAAGVAAAIAPRGVHLALDHVGLDDDIHLTDSERASLLAALTAAGHGGRLLVSVGAIGVAKGLPDDDRPFGQVLTGLVPLLAAAGLDEDDVRRILVDNPRDLLAVRTEG